MVFKATFNNISVISWRSDLLVEETGVPWENHRPEEYLLMLTHPKFASTPLMKVTTCVVLLRLLQDRDLLGINKLSFIKKILEHISREDLLTKVHNYEKESVKAVDAKSGN
jgi:hypothetical protein